MFASMCCDTSFSFKAIKVEIRILTAGKYEIVFHNQGIMFGYWLVLQCGIGVL